MLGLRFATLAAHVENDAPPKRAASVARPKISESGTFPITSSRPVESGEGPTVHGVDPYAEQAANMLRDALASVGATPTDLARALHVHPSLARSYCQPDQQRSLGLPKILRLCKAAPSLHAELIRRMVGACGDRGPASQDPGRDMILAMGACGRIAMIFGQIIACGLTRDRLPEAEQALAMARQTFTQVERAVEAVKRGGR